MRIPDNWHQAQTTVWIAVVSGLAALVIGVFQPGDWILRGAFFPLAWSQGGDWPWALVTPLTTSLLQFSLVSAAFSLLIFLLCGRAVEGALGSIAIAILCCVGAYAAAAVFCAVAPSSPIPLIGPAGAVAAVIGTYAMMFGRNRVRVANHRMALWLNAAWMLAAWVALQLVVGIVSTGRIGASLLPYAAANVAGFVAGLALARPLLLWRYRKA